MISITPIPAFKDNYLWLIHQQNKALIVDPGDAQPVIDYLQQHRLDLIGILLTHHHADHTGGVAALKKQYQCTVWGPNDPRMSMIDHYCQQPQEIVFQQLKVKFKVLDVVGHTAYHIAYLMQPEMTHDSLSAADLADQHLFCGDTLFSAGCGRLFEGSPQQMLESLRKIQQMADNTLIYPAHEYTQANIDFAVKLEPDNQQLLDYQKQVIDLREKNTPSLPTNVKQEKQINPFLRCKQTSIIQSAEKYAKHPLNSELEVFATIRKWKDQF